MQREKLVRDAFAAQAVWCDRLGSPFTARLMTALGRDLDRSTVTGKTVLEWSGQPDALGDSVPLRLAGALHALVRRGQLPGLAKLYPPHALPDTEALSAEALAAIATCDDDVLVWLKHPPQTNEVARSGVLYPGFMQIAADTGLPLALFEVGASAGLNMNPHLYAYDFDGNRYGDASSAVLIAPSWSGPAPGGIEPVIRTVRGCDRNPFDIRRDDHAERLVSYVWPDQPDRLARIEAACEIARDHPPKIDASDAADWVDDMFREPGEPGLVRVLYHSIAYQYFPEETQQRIARTMSGAGAVATAEAPVAWLSYELRESGKPDLSLQLWPGGDSQVLATGDAHVREITWKG
jgi:hypothetical protein